MNKKLWLLLFSNSLIFGVDLSLLTPNKQEIQNYKLKEIDSSYESEKYNWLSPATFSLSTTKTKPASSSAIDGMQSASIGVSQDIFRFGGIEYAISYANANKEYKTLSLEIENANYLEQISTLVLTIQKLKLQLEQSKYRLKNKELDIFLKKEQYKKGLVDITLLNNAIMDKNSELKNIITFEQSISVEEKELAKLTPKTYDTIEIPKFTLLDKEDFIKRNYQINQANLLSKATDTKQKITTTNYLPHLSANGEVGYQNYEDKYDGDYYSVGLKLTMPLDFNKNSTIEESKLASLQQKATSAS